MPAALFTHLNITLLNLTMVHIVRRQSQVWVSVDVTREWEDPNGIIALNNALSSLSVQGIFGTQLHSLPLL